MTALQRKTNAEPIQEQKRLLEAIARRLSVSRSARNPRIPRTTNYGLRRENDRAYAPFRMSIKGSSDSSIPSVSWPGRNSNFFSASAPLGTALLIVKTPSSTTLRSLGQGIVGSFVESSAAARLRLCQIGSELHRASALTGRSELSLEVGVTIPAWQAEFAIMPNATLRLRTASAKWYYVLESERA
jgi:hypothetical protein